MFSSFFNKTPAQPDTTIVSTLPFDQEHSFDHLREILKEFDTEEEALQSAASNMPPDSLEVRKHALFAEINKSIKDNIQKFNTTSHEDNKTKKGVFVGQILVEIIFAMSLDKHKTRPDPTLFHESCHLLESHRGYKKIAYNTAHFSSVSGMTLMGGGPTMTGVTLGVLGHLFLTKFENLTGFNGEATSAHLLAKLSGELGHLMKLYKVQIKNLDDLKLPSSLLANAIKK